VVGQGRRRGVRGASPARWDGCMSSVHPARMGGEGLRRGESRRTQRD
jgi:hypothetical protein